MTRARTNNRDRTVSTESSENSESTEAGREDQGELVERLRHNALQLLAGVPRPPRSLRIRAGDVSVDVEWAEEVVPVERVRPTDGVTPAPAPPAPPASDGDTARRYLTAPTVGTFYRATQPGAPPFVEEGDTVTAGQQVGIVEAMKVMIPVEADAGGRVVEVLKGDGEPVEYGERLLALAAEPAAEASQ